MPRRSSLRAVAVWLAFSVLSPSEAWAMAVTRGPFLQLADASSITVVWHTDLPGVGLVRYGTTPTNLALQASEAGPGLVHVVKLTGLAAATRYYYAIETGGTALGGGLDHSFRTYPVKGSPEPFRFIAWGDSGTANSGQLAVASRMKGQVGEPAFGLILGDIVYPNGEPWLFDPRYFTPYRELLRRMVIWPTIGNHDSYYDNGLTYRSVYYLPTNNPQGSELYYSFDYGDAHFVCLDTHVSGYSAGSAQLQWAAADLAASTARWKIVFFHAPPYSGGTHSDSSAVKANIVPLLEAANVDIVLAGHSHVYERTYLLKNGAILQSSKTAYTKFTNSPGSLYIVSGTAGQSGSLSNASHSLMAYQLGNTLGNTVIDVSGQVARGYFLKSDGTSLDLFSLYKAVDSQGPRVIGIRAGPPTNLLTVSFDEPVAAGSGASGAENPLNYAITPPIAVQSATLASDQRTVALATAAHPAGDYALRISNVQDRETPSTAVTAGTRVDYSFPGDAGAPDAGALDAGGTDAGASDAGGSDGGTSVPLFAAGGSWTHLVGTSALPSNWNSPSFDDSGWPSGAAPLGYGDPGIKTTVAMNGAATLYARAEFDLFVPPEGLRKLVLRVRYDDGFVASLNGAEVARRYVPAGQSRTTLANTSHEATGFETFDLSAAIGTLVAGDNLLAIEVHNVALSSSDLHLDAELSGVLKDVPPPYLSEPYPADGAPQVPVTTSISFQLNDDTVGVEPPDIRLTVNGALVDPVVSGTLAARKASFEPPAPFLPESNVSVMVEARNRNGVEMAPYRWSFATAPAQGVPGPDAGAPDSGAVASSCRCAQGAGSLPLAWVLGGWALRRFRRARGRRPK